MMGRWVWSVVGQADNIARCLPMARGQWARWRGLATTCPTNRREAWITATPRVCLHDVPTTLQAGGLAPNTPVTLSALLIDENDKHFVSHAHYVSDAVGEVDTEVAEAVSGSYTGVFPAGLLTTLVPAPHEFPSLRLYRRNPLYPWKVVVRMSEGHQPLETRAESVAKVEMERHLMAPGVRRVPVKEGRIRATMFLPAGEGPFPAVIDMFGTAGGLMEFRSALLASRGIASLALAYFAYEDLPKTTDSFDLEYFEEAVEVLLSQAGVVSDRCGVVAVSKATDIALYMATLFPKVKAVTCISGSPVALDSTILYRGSTLVEGIKMTLYDMMIDESGRLYPNREVIAREMSPEHPKFIPFHLADDETYFLMVAGADDAWACDIPVASTQKRMEKFGRGDKLKTVVYPGAGHILEPPYGPLIHHSYQRHLPVVSEDGSQKVTGMPMLWGGNARDTCVAQEDLWTRMRAFITKHVRDESPWYKKRLK